MGNLTTTQKLVVLALAWLLLSGGAGGGGAAPFKTDVLSVFVFEESADHGKYTADQLNVIQATDAKSVKAVVEAKGGRFKVLDQHAAAALTNAEPWLKEAFAVAAKNPPPWVVGATKTRGFSTPLTTEADLHKQLGGL